ncbi:hypothetical protein LEP1GSC150_1535 [Leptospira interrogans serovar Copenhageni str. LT2050]|uniref:DUF115 domain-containing protein n=1 Tax=Leptospira interrogans serovar Copenhageni str. LT2050 TaxID=1001598 RepID=M3IP38_LEPIT|nr:hypothetical protein LEP1GSC150_1535 [Leptospira interrogans serovar Copenhageni str. LT2050]
MTRTKKIPKKKRIRVHLPARYKSKRHFKLKGNPIGFPFHSRFNPIAEGERIAEQIPVPLSDKETVLIFGFGLGYHLESYLQKTNQPVSILVLEPIGILKSIAEKFFDRISKSYENKGHHIQIVFGLDEFLSHPLSFWLSEKQTKSPLFYIPFILENFPI